MSAQFGQKPCLDPETLRIECQRLGLPMHSWLGKANSFSSNLGPAAGCGCILMLRQHLVELDLEATHDLVISDGIFQTTIKNLLILDANAVTPGFRGDPNTAYLLELRDRRHLLPAIAVDRAYNVRATPGGSYLSATLNGGSPWTWSTLVSDLWSTVGTAKLGPFPGLPFTPHGTPESFSFYGSSAYYALNTVLDRIGCALRLDPLTDQFTIVQLTFGDGGTNATLAVWDNHRTWDDYSITPARATIPRTVKVHFIRQRAVPDTTGGSPYYILDRPDPAVGGALRGTEEGTSALLFDDMPAIYDSGGVLTNSAALSARADERAVDFFRKARQPRFDVTFTGAIRDSGVLPGPLVRQATWQALGDGTRTRVRGFPALPGGHCSEEHAAENDVFSSYQQTIGPSWFNAQWLQTLFHQAWVVQWLCNYFSVYCPAGGSGTTINVREVDLSPSLSGIHTLEFDQADGFVVSNPASGVARIDFVSGGGSTITVREVDLNPNLTSISIVEFHQADGFSVSQPGVGIAQVRFTVPTPTISIREVDGTPSLTGIHTIEVDQAAGYILTNQGGGVARLGFTSATATITVREVDLTPTVTGVSTIEFAESTGFVVTNQGGGVARVAMTFPIPTINVREVDLTPSYSGITTIEFDQNDGFVVSNPAAGVVRIDLVGGGGFNLTVREVDGAPSVANVNIIEFDQADGFVVSSPGAGIARIDFAGGAFNLTVREHDGVPSITNVHTISFDQSDGFIVVELFDDQAWIDLADATPSQKGIVNITAQTFGGHKTFLNGWTTSADSTSFVRGSLIINNGDPTPPQPSTPWVDPDDGGIFFGTSIGTPTAAGYGYLWYQSDHEDSTGSNPAFKIGLINDGSAGGTTTIIDINSITTSPYLEIRALGASNWPHFQLTTSSGTRIGQTAAVGGNWGSFQLTGGLVTGGGFWEATPFTSGDPGMVGQISFDLNFIYVCVANNSWKRAALSAF